MQAASVLKGVKLEEQKSFINLIHSINIIWAFHRLGVDKAGRLLYVIPHFIVLLLAFLSCGFSLNNVEIHKPQ